MDESVMSQGASKRQNIVFITLAVILLVAAAIAIGVYARSVPRGVDVDLIASSNQLTPVQKELETVLAANYHEYRNNSSWWSLAYFGCLFLSAFLSAMAALILKLECLPNRPGMKKDLAALCATTAALLITLSTVGNFQQKWQSNRLAATAVQNLVYEVWKEDAKDNKASVSSKMEQINLLRNQEIVGGITPAQGKPVPSDSQSKPDTSPKTPDAQGKPPANDPTRESSTAKPASDPARPK